MTLGPDQVDGLSLWLFGVLLRAHNKSNGGAVQPKAPSGQAHRDRMMRFA